nr:hypothetical protein [Tanacetum cinerariifolium]
GISSDSRCSRDLYAGVLGTTKLLYNSIRFKIDTKKSVLDLEAIREMLHISPRIPNQSFADLPTEEEILDFLRKKKGKSASSTTPPTPTPTTTVESAPWLSATAKDEGTGSKPGVPDVPSNDSEEELSWNSSDDEDVGGHEEGNKSDESDDDHDEGSDDDSDETVKAGAGKDDDDDDDEDDDDNDEEEELAKSDEEDKETGKGGDEVRESEGESDEEESRKEEEESFDPIPKTPEEKAVREAVQIQTDRLQDSLQQENDEFLRNIDENMKKIIKGQVKNQVKEQVLRILPRIEESVNATLEAKVLTRSSHSSRTSYAIGADLSEMELKKILIEKMEGNKSIQRSNEQRNLYKVLVEAYDADKAILETYGDSTILKRRREDDDQEGPSAGSDRGESAFAEEPVQTTCQMEETPHLVFETADLSKMELKKILIDKMEGNKEDVRMTMIRKDPPLDQTEGLRDVEKEGSMHQPTLHLNQLPGVQADLLHELNLDSCLPVSLLLQRNLCRLPVRWRNPHIRCLKQVQKINPLFKLLSILNSSPSQGNHQHQIMIGTKLCQLFKETLSHG